MMGISMCCPAEEEDDEKGYLFAPDVDTYEGEKNRKKQKHGKGVYYYSNGDIYDGYWQNNKKHGQGEYRFRNGKVLIGYFKKDQFVGNLRNEEEDGVVVKSKKKKKEKAAKPLWVDDDGLIRSSTPPPTKTRNVDESPRKLIDHRSRYDGITDEQKQLKVRAEQMQRERSERAREQHLKTTERIRKKYNLPNKKTATV